jgi:hypothetical protein
MFNPKILTAMKQKLKKIGVLAVLLASFATYSNVDACNATATCLNGGTVSCSGSYSCHAGDGFVTCTNVNGSSNTASCGSGRKT